MPIGLYLDVQRRYTVHALGHGHPFCPSNLSRHPPETGIGEWHCVRVPASIVLIVGHTNDDKSAKGNSK